MNATHDMALRIIPAGSPDQFALIEKLARRIIPEFYDQYLPAGFGDLLIELSHNAAVIEKQAAEGYRHFILDWDEETAGYFAVCPKGTSLMLSKFYLLPSYRGKGIGRAVVSFVETRARETGKGRIVLLVLRQNAGAVALYRKCGFTVAREVLTRVGNEYVLEDFYMKKEIEKQ